MIGRGIQDAYELSPVQAGMLFQTRLEPDSAVYVVQLWTRLSGTLDPVAFRDAWAWAVSRHPVLRTGFVTNTAKPVQVVHAQAALPIHAHDWTGADEAETERRIQALAAEDRARPFDLAAPPLLRLHLARLAADEHVLLWSLHHLVLDGWSYTTLFREVLAKYDALLRGTEFDPPAPRPYREFIGWIKGRDRAAAEAFWRQALAGVAEPTPLGVDTGPQGGDGDGYGDHNRWFSAELTAALHEAARTRRVTLATLVEGAWALVLSRYAGTDDVVFGWTGSGRPESLSGAERMCGLFVNTLPARVRVEGETALGPWLRGLQEAQLAAREHEHVPLVDVQGWTEVARGRPLFESILAFENFPRIGGAGDGTGGLTVGAMRGASSTGYPLTLILHPGERMHLRAYADRARIGDAAARRLLGHLETALRSMADAPVDALLRELEILPAEERALVLGPWAAPRRDYPARPMHRLFAEHAARTPEKVAVTAADGSLTYGELEARANRLSQHLMGLGVRPGQIVAMGLDRGTQRIVTLLAIVKAGAAYLPLDAAYPIDRLAFLMGDAGARVIVTDEKNAPALPTEGHTTVLVDTHAAEIAAASAAAPRVMVNADDPLYVVYTSGSTGTPKGVILSHRALARLVRGVDYADWGPDQVWMHFSALTFDTSAMEVWGALANGGRLAVFAPHQPSLDELGAFWREQGVTTVWLTAGLFHQMVDGRLADFGVLRQVMAGGDILSVAHCRRLLEAHPHVRLINGYGPSENGTYTSAHVIRPDDLRRTSIPIGRPVPCTTCYLLDGRMQPVPVGVWGELYTGGDGVAIGYLNRPEMTAERFIPLTLDGVRDRVYRTGDRVRWMEDGVMEFLGRSDFQVKIRGFRVEPGEVEQALQAHPAVREAAVVARVDARGEKRLVGYFVGDVSVDDVRELLRGRLPEHMVPGAFVRMDGLPLNRHGKVDRGALPDPADFADDAAAEYVAPRSETEELLAALWAEVLGAERVGVTESFFAAGGHSLQAMQLVTRVREALRVEVPLRTLFEAPSVAELAATLAADPVEAERIERTARLARVVRRMPEAEVRALLESTAGEAKGRTEAARRQELLAALLRAEGVIAPEGEDGIAPRGDAGPAPLSFAQERLWVIDQLEPGSAAYTIAAGLRLRGALNVDALRRAFAEIVRRHEALRTTIVRGADGEPVQVVAPALDIDIALADLSTIPVDEREAKLAELVAAEAARPFDIAAGPLVRIHLARLADDHHALLLLLHHVVADGWSLGVLYRELGALYKAYDTGAESPLAPLAVQYPDYAAWQRAKLDASAVDAQAAWWKRQLAGLPEVLRLPTDRPRPAVASQRGATVPVRIPAELADAVRELSRREGTTLFMTLLAGFAALLHRYTGEADFAVGTPVAGRTRPETEALIGLFVNTLVLRADLSGGPTFRDLLARVRETTLGAFARQDVPFERLVDEVDVGRSLGHTPLFQVMFALQNAGELKPSLDGVQAERLAVTTTGARTDLTWSLVETADGIAGLAEYATDLFDASTVERMLEHFRTLLAAAVADPSAPVAELPIVSEDERDLLLAVGEGSTPDVPGAAVDALFAEHAAATPDAVALAWDGGRMTYGELDARANRLARHLRGRGVAAGTRVGLCLERGPEAIVATLAVLKAGGAYVPLDPSYPVERLAFMLEDTAVPVLVTESALAGRLPAHAGPVVSVDDDAAAIAAEPADPLPNEAGADSVLYVMYTSGSTGRPKGIEVPHRAVARLVRGQDFISIDRSDVFLHLAPASFDAATLELWGPLLNGATLAIHPAGAPSVESIERALAQHGVTTLWLTAGLFHLVVEENIQALAGVRQLLAGGDVLSVPHVRRVLAELPGTALINGYGPTENTTFTCCHRITSADEGSSIPIGRPIANTYVRVLDAGMQPVPVGVPGELYAGGAGLSIGYLNRPELTAEKFVADPFAPGARLYRTGDRVRWRADGTVEFLGRVDTQVKIRGFRIEPGEVEAVILSHPAVREAAVVVREDAGEKRLVAYFAGDVSVDEVRDYLRGRLPEHMLPSAVVAMDAIPLTPNGKVDRAALPAPDASADEQAFVAPRTATEQVLAGLWSAVLGVDAVGANDGFFALGGHSLRATRLASRVREVFGIELPLRAVFERATLADLAREIDARVAGGADALPPIVPVERGGTLPLSFAQQRLWFLEQLEPGSALYNVPVAVRLSGELNEPALARALGEIVRRHESLRTTFAGAGATARQVIAPPAEDFALPFENLTTFADPEASALRRATEEAELPFHLDQGPLFRARLLRVRPAEHVLLITLHHAVSDGWSMGVLFRELGALYKAYETGAESPLPPLEIQYADFAVWQRGVLDGPAGAAQLAYWKRQLAGAPAVLELPTDRPRPAVQTYRGGVERMELSTELADAVRAAGRREGATLFMTLLAAYQALLSRHAGQDDVVVGSPIAGRTRGETEGLIGFFVNTLALRGDLSGDPDFRALLARVRQATLGAYAHQDLPFERLVEEVQPERSLGHSPVFQAFFVLQDTRDWSLELPGVRAERLPVEESQVKFDLSLAAAEGPEGVRLSLYYNRDLWDASTIRRMLEQLGMILAAASADPALRVSELPLLSDAERAEQAAWYAGPPVPEACPSFPARFAARVAAAPDAIAILHGGERVTYAQLDARANRIAHRLRVLGVGPEVPVGLCLPRTPELVAAALGILKAGGAYLPVEPHFPPERIAAVMGDAGAAVLVAGAATLDAVDLPASCRALRMDDAETRAAIDALPDTAPAVDIHPESLAVVIYTSGSTGRPKGVMLRHEGVARFVEWMGAAFPLAPGEVVLGSTSLAFDVHVAEVEFALGTGATLLLVQDAMSLAEIKPDFDIAQASMVPTAARELLNLGALPGRVRRLNTAGEAHPADLARALYAAGLPEINNLYGPTEDTVYCTRWAVPADVQRMRMGRPFDGRRQYVLDAGLSPVPAGVEGDLWLAGCGLARGYLGRPALTAERFLPDPYGPAGARMYLSGDRARWTVDGDLEFAGRADFQVKIRGFRIEPGEIEAVLRAHPSVADAVVAAHGTELARRLAAWVVARDGAAIDPAALAAHARETLPPYMVPGAIVALDAFPRTASGKLDRKALPAPDFAAEEARYVAPRTDSERVVAEVFARVLDLERAGATDDFFVLGGHSLLAMHVWSYVRERCGVELPLRAVFEHPTVEALAAAVDAAPRAQAAPAEDRITARRRTVRAVRIAPGAVDEFPDAVVDAAAGGDDR
jgi:amino acid adenylation domain-containing protein